VQFLVNGEKKAAAGVPDRSTTSHATQNS